MRRVPALTVASLFGQSLRRIRKEKGLTQERLAELTGLSTNFISELERGLKAPGLAAIVSISKALDVSVHDLLANFTPAKVRSVRS